MNELQPQFDGKVGDEFTNDYYNSVRGYVRQEITRLNLLPFINTQSDLVIADIGGGDGRDSEWASSMGHEVTLIEPSSDMLEKARSRGAAKHLIRGDIDTAIDIKLEGRFDAVMSHGVIMYDPDPEAHVKKLASLLKRGGTLSLLASGYNGVFQRLFERKDYKGVKELRQKSESVNELGVRRRVFSHHELQGMLNRSGMKVERWGGVRSMIAENTHAKVDEMDPEELRKLLLHEYHYGLDRPTRDKCQLLHFIASKV